jgi:hypothetical protein
MNYLKTLLVLSVAVLFTACASKDYSKITNNNWKNFKSWTKVTSLKPETGDTTGFLAGVHKGSKGYRDVFVNSIGEKALLGSAPYNFPKGTVIVKEQFDDLAAYEKQVATDLTIMVKLKDSDTLSADNWGFAESQDAEVKANNFCSSCHSIATNDDFIFTTGDYIRNHSLAESLR